MQSVLMSRSRKKLNKIFTYVILLVAIALTIIPLVWMTSASLSLPTSTIGKGLDDESEYSWILPKNI